MCQLNRFLDSELWRQYVTKRILHSNMQMNTQHLPRQKFFPNISLRLHTSAWTVETSPYHSSFSLRRIATDQIQYQHCDYKIRLQRRFGAVEERWTLISDYQVQKDTPAHVSKIRIVEKEACSEGRLRNSFPSAFLTSSACWSHRDWSSTTLLLSTHIGMQKLGKHQNVLEASSRIITFFWPKKPNEKRKQNPSEWWN